MVLFPVLPFGILVMFHEQLGYPVLVAPANVIVAVSMLYVAGFELGFVPFCKFA